MTADHPKVESAGRAMRTSMVIPPVMFAGPCRWREVAVPPVSRKLHADARHALSDLLADGQTFAVGGFGLCGIPEALIAAVRDSGIRGLTVISNNPGTENFGLGQWVQQRQVRRFVGSYVGENKEFQRQYLAGEIELELTPQGSLAERLRAAGAGIPGFYTATGYGTVVAEGKETREFDGRHYVLEKALHADIALVKAWKADAAGNLLFRHTARNFNPVCAKAGKVCVAEMEELVDVGMIDPDAVHLPGIYVDRIVLNPHPEKRIDVLMLREEGR